MIVKKFTLFIILKFGIGSFFIKSTLSQDINLNLNTKKIIATTSDKFLSLTIDPAVLLTGDVLTSSTELSTNMAKAFSPGYVRLAGPKTNSYTFQRSLFPQNDYQDPDLTFSEAHWVLVQQWAQRSGLEIVASLAPQRMENDDQLSTWDSRNSMELISFSDHMGYNISWQLGYECQTRVDVNGFDLGKDIVRLRNILATFPRYSSSVIAGPDIVSFRGKIQQQFIQDYINAAGNSLSVITWHPDFAGIALDSDGVALQTDTLAVDKDLLYKSMGRSALRKPLWIAESKAEPCKQQFLGALVWARRLGNAAKLGVQVIMRQPDASTMFQPTPDYWVSLLHKMLVGKEVLEAKLTSGNKTHVHFYCQCTKPSAKYDRGSITIFGINLTPGKISVSLKGLKIKAVHKYILMPGYDTENRMFAETVLLNDEPLILVNGKNLPEINPAVNLMGKNMAVKLPSGGIGFWVIPGARVKSCLGHDDESGMDKNLLLKKLAKKLEDQEVVDENYGQELETDNINNNNNNNNQDIEAESTEDIKSLLLKSKKKKVGSKYRHNDDQDDEDRRFKRIDTKKEFEKLEKLLKRNNNNNKDQEKNIQEEEEEEEKDEDVGLMRFKGNEKIDSGEEIRTKLEEYKNKLNQYETRKKLNDNQKLDKTYEKLSSNDVDAQKAVEALALISKVEEAMRENVKSDDKKSLNKKDFDIGEEMLIQELEKSADKRKRMIDQKSFGKIYEYLMNNNNNREKFEKRNKRDLEKLLGDDPLGLRKDGLFKKRPKIDEVKERRLERRNRKKDKEDIGLKKELSITKFDPRNTADSIENNFYGFPQMKPIENFPQGDIFLSEGTSASEEKSRDYDYVKEDDDDDDDEKIKLRRNTNKNRRAKQQRRQNNNKQTLQDETWIEDSNSNVNQMPNEFFERFNLPPVTIKTQWKDYVELYEPESVQATKLNDDFKQQENETLIAGDAVIVKDRHDEREDKRAKETAVKKLINYYDNSEVLINEPQELMKKEKPQRPKSMMNNNNKFKIEGHQIEKKLKPTTKPEELIQREENMKKLFNVNNNYEEDNSEDVGSMEFVSSKADDDYSDDILYSEDDLGLKKRPKRKIKNLNHDAFGQEMINEDIGNLKDCKCRVIRSNGNLECKNCKIRRRQRDVIEETGQSIESKDDEDVVVENTTENSKHDIKENEDKNMKQIETEELEKPSKTDLELKFESSSNEPEAEEEIERETETEKSLEVMKNNDSIKKNDKETGEKSDDTENKKKTVVDIEENLSSEEMIDDVQSKRDIGLVSSENTESLSGTKISLGTGEKLGTSSKSEIVGSKLKNAFDLKLKTEGRASVLKNDFVKNKLSLNSDSLSELMKEKEVKKLEVIKALESSTKLKSNDNKKYVEYQKKQAEKLSILKEKLKERKAKILQQYRQELIEALNKCDSEVERNLKRREIWNNYNNKQEFIDNDKLSYLITNRPVNYEGDDDDDDDDKEDRRYYPEIEFVQPIREPRERRIVSQNNNKVGYFYWPKIIDENHDNEYDNKMIENYDDDDKDSSSYYAFVENLENPKILNKKQFDNNYHQGFNNKHRDFKSHENNFENDKREEDRHRFLEKPVYVIQEQKEKEEEDEKAFEKTNYWDYLIPEYHDGIMHHKKKYTKSIPSSEVRINRELKSNNNDFYDDDDVIEIPCSDGKCGNFYNNEEVLSVNRNGRETREKRSNYVCLKEDSKEDSDEVDEDRVYKLIKNEDHYEAVPILRKPSSELENVEIKAKRLVRRLSRNDEKIRSKRRKSMNDDLHSVEKEEEVKNYYYKQKNGKYLRKNLSHDDEIDYRAVGDEANRLESDKYEVLMLIPVKKHKIIRQKRDLSDDKNDIERFESNENEGEDMTGVWHDIVDIKESEKRLKEYVDAKQKTYNDFQEAQANLNWYLKKLQSMTDPVQMEEFDRFVLNLGSNDQDDMTMIISQSQNDDVQKILLGEYLKKEVLDTVHNKNGIIDEEQTSRPTTTTTTVENLFDATMPKLKSTINNEIEKVGNLTESLENFINEFDENFNKTLNNSDDKKNYDIDNNNDGENNDSNKKRGKISYNLFHNALNSVKKFFDFLTGVSLVFRRH